MAQNKQELSLKGAGVERIDGKTVEICWEPPEAAPEIHVRAKSPAESAQRVISADESNAGCIRISGLDPVVRYFFEIREENGPSFLAAERRICMDGAVNFRDLGGYPAEDGRRVKWGRIFRSDGLARLSDRDHLRFEQMGIRHVFDFRTISEAENSPDRLPDNGIRRIHLPVIHGEFDFVVAMERLKKGDASWLTPDFMVNGYINNLEEYAGVWGDVINHMANGDRRPILFHCTGGKDRTGTCAALILLMLGVDRETVIADHQLSNVYIADLLPKIHEMIAAYGVDPDILFPYLTAPRECIDAVLDYIEKNYGTPSDYLAEKAGVDRPTQKRLKEDLLG